MINILQILPRQAVFVTYGPSLGPPVHRTTLTINRIGSLKQLFHR